MGTTANQLSDTRHRELVGYIKYMLYCDQSSSKEQSCVAVAALGSVMVAAVFAGCPAFRCDISTVAACRFVRHHKRRTACGTAAAS